MVEGTTQAHVKKELLDPNIAPKPYTAALPALLIELSSSDSDSDSDSDYDNARKKRRLAESAVLPLGFLDPLPQPSNGQNLPLALPSTAAAHAVAAAPIAKQFWKAGDYEDGPSGDWGYSNGDVFISAQNHDSCMWIFALVFEFILVPMSREIEGFHVVVLFFLIFQKQLRNFKNSRNEMDEFGYSKCCGVIEMVVDASINLMVFF